MQIIFSDEPFEENEGEEDSFYTVASGSIDEDVRKLDLAGGEAEFDEDSSGESRYEDEWDDDDDNGYITVTISTDEFFAMEEVSNDPI